jgi:hypothetical protein
MPDISTRPYLYAAASFGRRECGQLEDYRPLEVRWGTFRGALASSSHVEAITSWFPNAPSQIRLHPHDQQAGEPLPVLIRRIEALLPLGADDSPFKPTTMNN